MHAGKRRPNDPKDRDTPVGSGLEIYVPGCFRWAEQCPGRSVIVSLLPVFLDCPEMTRAALDRAAHSARQLPLSAALVIVSRHFIEKRHGRNPVYRGRQPSFIEDGLGEIELDTDSPWPRAKEHFPDSF